jgi:hypothetical protein
MCAAYETPMSPETTGSPTAEYTVHSGRRQSTMAKVLWHIMMSLDGFIESPDGSTEWRLGHGETGPAGREVVR